MKKQALMIIMMFGFIFNVIEYNLPCEWGLCHYEFWYDEEEPNNNFLIVRSHPIWYKQLYHCCKHTEISEVYSESECYNQYEYATDWLCKEGYTMEKGGGYQMSEYRDIVHDIKLDPLTRKHLLDKITWR